MWIDQWMRNKTAIHVCLSTITNKLFYTLGIFLFRSKRKRISEKCRKRRENQPIEIIVLNFTTTIGLYNLNQSYTQSIEITRWFLGSSILAALFSLALHRSPSLCFSSAMPINTFNGFSKTTITIWHNFICFDLRWNDKRIPFMLYWFTIHFRKSHFIAVKQFNLVVFKQWLVNRWTLSNACVLFLSVCLSLFFVWFFFPLSRKWMYCTR